MEIVLVAPEIPHNSGCIARLSAGLGLRLHMIEPLGFSLEDRYLKRAGLDYWPMVDLVVHRTWEHARTTLGAQSTRPFDERLKLFSARGGTSLFQTTFHADDLLVFGCESRGLPPELLDAHPARRVYVPIRAGIRSLNLASVVSVATYTALVAAGVELPHNDGSYEAHPDAQASVSPITRVTRFDA